ncbi:hypothetical protein FB567DRAFT_49318 [Paraphoma chrysanthemicola]|uniref:Uncharacterized protein n=1 Tax=Paraphoma chrysanthemicola TaxID=798071 RepID=A0A8K0R6A2_9PLEO|nr:hypothetical protein FB567DRAFT_49318 [Paraphoma chrysanthemicola]
MSGLDPKGAAQPTQNQAYTTPGNPADTNPSEQKQASFNAADNSASTDQRIPTKQATDEQGLRNAKYGEGAGIHGAPAGEEAKGLTEEDVGRHNELNGEQMRASGEGDVAAAVAKGGKGQGGGGAEPDLASDLDRKKAEQADARNAIKQSKGDSFAAGGAAGQTGGPANPVGQNNYPNSGSG